MTGLPYPTPTRLAFADEISHARIRWYNFVRPVAFHAVTGYRVTSALDEFVAAGLASVPACAEGSSSVAELTPEGMAWVTRARTADTKITAGGPVSTSPETGPGACRRAEWCVLPDDGHSAWECSIAQSTKDEERTEKVCADYPDCREERYVSDLLASVKAGEPVGKWVSGCASCEQLAAERTEGGA